MAQEDFAALGDAELVRRAMSPSKVHAKALAIEQLALRALRDHSLLKAACDAIAQEKTLQTRMGPPLGWLGAAAILTSGDSRAIGFLLNEMRDWSATEQQDVVRLVAGPHKLAEKTRELEMAYGWKPRYQLPP